ncbi:TPA: hypothetical protein I8303_004498 [Aeromonas hydrophila]|nr:hypothetical protein [Aeromonas hydrophila]
MKTSALHIEDLRPFTEIKKTKMALVTEYAKVRNGDVVFFYSALYVKVSRPSHRLYVQLACQHGHVWNTQVNSLLKNETWCPKCAYANRHGVTPSSVLQKTIEQLVATVSAKGGRLVTPKESIKTSKDEVTVYCSERCIEGREHGEFIVSIPDLLRGKGSLKKGRGVWCSKCKFEFLSTLHLKPFFQCRSEIEALGWRIISPESEYQGAHSKLRAVCSNGHENIKSVTKYLSGGGCRACFSGIGRGEEVCRLFFQHIFGQLFPKSRPVFLNGLEFDGYSEILRIAFEYDGPHHSGKSIFGRDSTHQISRDREKDRLACENGVTLIRVSWIEEDWSIPRWKFTIENAIKAAGIPLPFISYDDFDPFGKTTQRDDISRIREVEKRLMVRCLDGHVYRGVDYHYQWLCEMCGRDFLSTLYVMAKMRSLAGCNKCVAQQRIGIKRPISPTRQYALLNKLSKICMSLGFILNDDSWNGAKSKYTVICIKCKRSDKRSYNALVRKNSSAKCPCS